ncbi:MAG TPA: 5'-nucleotidase C-terminal domain-containing protein [Minicystis sp.]|nr:5'-nucleotidase C-terminal domain-containing protein [Minicystis sp.]
MSDVPSGARGPRLRLVCVNDVYTLENLPRLRTLVLRARTEDPADVLLTTLAGDFVSPSMLSSLDRGAGMVDCMNHVPITHVTFGNHEDDIPPDELRARVREFSGTWLSTNVVGLLGDDPRAPDGRALLPACQIVKVTAPGGRRVRVGLLGVVMTDPSLFRGPPFGGVALLPANAAALGTAAHLVDNEGCACVVPLTHQEMARDRELAAEPQRVPFPVVVGGHEHVVEIEKVAATWIVKAGSDATHAVVVDLAWPAAAPIDGAPDVPEVTVRLEDVSRYPEDGPMRGLVDAHMAAVRALEAATLLVVPPGAALSSVGSRAQETSLGALVCSRLRDATGAEACVFNGGGIRGARTYTGRFTYGDLKAEIPFDNEVVVVPLPGAVLADAVATSRARAPLEYGGFLQVDDGMRVEEPEDRLTRVAGAPLDPARDYKVALVRNLFEGMDHIEPLVRFAREHPERVPKPTTGRDAKLLLLDALCRALFRELGDLDAIDANHDGFLDASEMAAAIARVTAEPASAITVDLMMRALGAERGQALSRAAAVAARGAR